MLLSQPVQSNAGDMDVQIVSRQESHFPHLTRLCTDFSFQVSQINVDGCDSYRLTIVEGKKERNITPAFSNMEQLEGHIQSHLVDILHSYVFDVPPTH